MTTNRPIADATSVVLASATSEASGSGGAVARWLADALELPDRVLHLDEPADDPDELADHIADRLPTDALLVMESHHADRWASRASVTEHVLDAFGGPAVVAGPGTETPHRGPIVVALDGSPEANQAIGPAITLARAVGGDVVLATIAPEPLDASPDLASADQLLAETAANLPSDVGGRGQSRASNDPVGALAEIASDVEAALLVLVSKGDRTIARGSMSRTATGLVATAACPVVIVSAG